MIGQVPGQTNIIDRLETITGVDVYEGQYVYDGAMPAVDDNGLFVPYISTIFGASYKTKKGSRGIVSERHDPKNTTVTVYCIAPTDRLARTILDDVRDKLEGYSPTDATQLAENGGYNYVDSDLGVNRYVHSAVFAYTTNLSFVA